MGSTAPPTIAMFSSPDPLPVRGPSSATPRLKIVGNMIELKNPTARIVHIAVWPPNIMEATTSAAPVERNISSGGLSGHSRDGGQAEIVHQKTANGNLRAHIRKNPKGAKEK